MNLLKNLNHLPAWRYQPETLAYRTAMNNLGGISERSLQHLDKFVRDCKETGVWPRLTEVMPFCGLTLAGAGFMLKSASGNNGVLNNFVSGDYTEATGLTGDGSTKYIDTGIDASALPSAGHLSIYQRNDNLQTSARVNLGTNFNTNVEQFWIGSNNPATRIDAIYGKQVLVSNLNPMVKGFYYAERQTTTDLKLYRNNTQLAAVATSVVHAPPSLNLFAWALNVDNTPGFFNSFTGSFLSIGQAMTAQERTDFYSIVQTLQSNLGRAV